MFSFLRKANAYDNPQFLEQVKTLKSRDNDPIAKIALSDLKKTETLINRASNDGEIIVNDMYEANRIPLAMLKPGQKFHGISTIFDPLDWAHDESLIGYKNTNYDQAAKGVIIERTFVMQNYRDLDGMRSIMDEQVEHGITVSYVMEDDLKSLSYFPDFSVFPAFNLVIYVPNLNNTKTCIATCDGDLVQDIMKDYATILKYATTWNGFV